MAENVVAVAQKKQPQLFNQFMNLVSNNELSHAYLFTGEDGAGQFSVAMGVAMRLFFALMFKTGCHAESVQNVSELCIMIIQMLLLRSRMVKALKLIRFVTLRANLLRARWKALRKCLSFQGPKR